MKRGSTGFQLILFLIISYSHLWLLFGIARLFDIPFTFDPQQLGGQLVLLGIPASLIATILTTLYHAGSNGRPRVYIRIQPYQELGVVIMGVNKSEEGAHDFEDLSIQHMAQLEQY